MQKKYTAPKKEWVTPSLLKFINVSLLPRSIYRTLCFRVRSKGQFCAVEKSTLLFQKGNTREALVVFTRFGAVHIFCTPSKFTKQCLQKRVTLIKKRHFGLHAILDSDLLGRVLNYSTVCQSQFMGLRGAVFAWKIVLCSWDKYALLQKRSVLNAMLSHIRYWGAHNFCVPSTEHRLKTFQVIDDSAGTVWDSPTLQLDFVSPCSDLN